MGSETQLRKLMDEFRPSMTQDVLLAWAGDVVAAWQGEAAEKTGPGDFADRQFFQGFGFCLAHIARDMRDDHSATMFATQNGFTIDNFTGVDLDPYDMDPLLVAFADDLPVEYWTPIDQWDRKTTVLFGVREEDDDWRTRFSDSEDTAVSHDTPMCIDGRPATHFLMASHRA